MRKRAEHDCDNEKQEESERDCADELEKFTQDIHENGNENQNKYVGGNVYDYAHENDIGNKYENECKGARVDANDNERENVDANAMMSQMTNTDERADRWANDCDAGDGNDDC